MKYAPPGQSGSIVTVAPRYENFIGGKWIKPVSGRTMAVENPCRRETIAMVGAADKQDVDAAFAAAKAAFPNWRRMAARARGALLTELGNRVSAHAEEIAKVLAAETGNALRTQSRPEVASTAEVLRYYGGVVSEQANEQYPSSAQVQPNPQQ